MSTAAAAPPRLTPFACAALICAHIKSCMAHSGSLRNFQLKTSCRERQKTNRLGLARAERELLWRGMNYSLSPSANLDRARTGDMQPAPSQPHIQHAKTLANAPIRCKKLRFNAFCFCCKDDFCSPELEMEKREFV